MPLDPRRLRLFAAVARAGSITSAAADLGVSQPALSEQLRTFEEECGQPLLIRHARGVRPTAVGERLVEMAARIDRVLGEASDVLARRSPSDELKVGGSSTAAVLLPALVQRFAAVRPVARIWLQQGDTRLLESRVADGALPLALVAGSGRSSKVTSETYLYDHMVPVCAPDWPLPRSVSMQDLARWPVIWRESGSGSRSVVEKQLGIRMKPSDPIVEGLPAQMSSAKAGFGIAFVSELVVADDLRAGSLRVVPVPEARVRRTLSWIFGGGRPVGVAGQLLAFAQSERARRTSYPGPSRERADPR
jgi:molybdate transport repressor ModE-like protein